MQNYTIKPIMSIKVYHNQGYMNTPKNFEVNGVRNKV